VATRSSDRYIDESDLNRLELKIQQAEVAIFQRIVMHSHQLMTGKRKRSLQRFGRHASYLPQFDADSV